MTPFSYHQILLQVQDLNLVLGGNQILKNLNLTIHNIVRDRLNQGQVLSILGNSGIGKSQLFRIIAGLNHPTSGRVVICERGSTQPVEVQVGRVGVVAQSYPLFENRTVWGNLLIAGRLAGLSTSGAEIKASALLDRFQMFNKCDSYAAELSGGQRQRVAISQQLMRSPMFLLLDEPFSGLDPVMKDKACELISEVAGMDELMTIIVVTHDIGSAIQISDNLALMGRDRAGDGSVIPGAYIKESIDLAARGLAWRKDITFTQEFADCVKEVREKFNNL